MWERLCHSWESKANYFCRDFESSSCCCCPRWPWTPGNPPTHGNIPSSASQVLGLYACYIMLGSKRTFNIQGKIEIKNIILCQFFHFIYSMIFESWFQVLQNKNKNEGKRKDSSPTPLLALNVGKHRKTLATRLEPPVPCLFTWSLGHFSEQGGFREFRPTTACLGDHNGWGIGGVTAF